jgi:peptidoglycan/xylan/chitin deacetylase (PgdA/CDA1 family)
LGAVWLLAALCAGCGERVIRAPAVTAPDIFHDVWLRGTPTPEGQAGRVALTFDGLGGCTPAILDALEAAGAGGGAPVPATFFFSARAVATLEADAGGSGAALVRRIVDAGHGVALGVEGIPASWLEDAVAFRSGLDAATRALAQVIDQAGAPPPGTLVLWRPPLGGLDRKTLTMAANADRPAVLWSRHVGTAAAARTLDVRVSDGDILAFPAADADCAVADLVAPTVRSTQAAGLAAARLDAVLGRAMERYAPIRLVRYFGPSTCGGADDALRWGLVVGGAREDVLRVRPLPVEGPSTAALLSAGTSALRSTVGRAPTGCVLDVPLVHVRAPVTRTALGDRRARWWVVGPTGVRERDARALGPPTEPLVLPTRDDLVRIEARQRLPWRLRGVVGGALDRLGLHSPLMIHATARVGVVVAAPLSGSALESLSPDERRRRLTAALGGYVQMVEASIGEYLYLADWNPRHAAELERAARAADGFVRAGPWITVPAVAGGAPDPALLGVNGRPALAVAPTELLDAALRAGVELAPGDVIAPASAPVSAVEEPLPLPETGLWGSAGLRQLLEAAMTDALRDGRWLRPGQVLDADAGWAGRQTLRVAAAPGVAVPGADVSAIPRLVPVLEDRPGGAR